MVVPAARRVSQGQVMTTLHDLKQLKGHTSIYWNVRSLLPRLEEIDRVIDLANPEFMGLTESWLTSATDDVQVCFDGYNIHRGDRTQASGKKEGGGVIMYYSDKLNCLPLNEYTRCTPHIECVWLALRLPNTKQINVGTIYRPP